MSQDQVGSLNGSRVDAQSVDTHLVVVIGQTTSLEDIKLTLTQLNSSLNQIGKPVYDHINDIVDAIRHKQFEKSNYDQQQRIGYSNDIDFTFELLVNPLVRSVRQSFKNLVTSERKQRYLVNLSGDRANQGDINCSDSSLSCDDLLTLLADPNELTDEQRKSLKQTQSNKITLLMPQRVVDANRAWKSGLEKQYAGLSVQAAIASDGPENVPLNDAVIQLLNQTPIDQLLEKPKHKGTLKISRPTVYIFPSLQGDSTYFTINGYSMLINGGYDRLRPCFWKFVSMLPQIDSVLITHTDTDALGGLASFFAKKAVESECEPAVLAVLGNLVHSRQTHQAAQLIASELASNGHKPGPNTDVDVILEAIEKLKIKLLPLVKNHENLLLPFNKTQNALNKYEHINLYSKLGHGSLDLYVLSPYANSPEYKEFYHQQQQSFARQTSANLQKSHLAVHGVYKQLPLSHLASAVCLLVWMPAAQRTADTALRLLFTGNAPQHVILNALDKIKDLELLNEPVYRVKPEAQAIKKQVSASGMGEKKEKEAPSNGKLNTSISNKPVGTANGHHDEVSKSKPPVPVQSSAKPQPAKSASSSKPPQHTNNATSLNTSLSAKDSKDAVKPESAPKKPPVPTNPGKKKSLAAEHEEKPKEAVSADKPAEKVEKKKPAVPKRESTMNGGGPAKSSHSDTTASASSSAPTRPSLLSHAVSKESGLKTEKSDKPEPKPPVPKQQPKPAPKPADTKPVEKPKTENVNKKSSSTKKPEQPAKKLTGTGPKTLTLSMGSGEGAVLKGGSGPVSNNNEAPKQAEASVSEPIVVEPVAAETPLIDLGQQAPSSVESVETRMHEEVDANSREDVVVQHVEQVEQIEKIEQVVNVEQVVEQIVASQSEVDELVQQPHQYDHEPEPQEPETNHFGRESPNLSPVKKEFGALNHSHVDPVAGQVEEDAPVVEEQLTSEAVTTGEIEILSGNLNGEGEEAAAAAELIMKDDVMTRSFIEDGPGTNPFANPIQNGDSAPVTTNGNHLDESCDLNRTHELFEGDESSSSINTAPNGTTNGNGEEAAIPTNGGGEFDDKLISGLESLKLANQSMESHPNNWNLLELPKPVNPSDNIIDPSHVELNDKMELDSKPDMTSSPAGAGGPSTILIAEKKQAATTNGKSKPSSSRTSVEPNKATSGPSNSASTGSNQKASRQAPIHPAYVELTYVPAHGSEHHVDAEFFKRVRARHYVVSALEPSEHVMNALCDGKETWEDKHLEVSVIPTYEGEALRKWYLANEERLKRLKIDIVPAASYAQVTFDENSELACQVFRLEF